MPKLDKNKILFDASRLSADDIRKTLIESADLKYENRVKVLRLDLINKALSGIIIKKTKELAEEMGANLHDKGTQKRLSEWLEDMRINGIEHPEFWDVCARFLMRALRGELLDSRQEYPAHHDSKSRLLKSLS